MSEEKQTRAMVIEPAGEDTALMDMTQGQLNDQLNKCYMLVNTKLVPTDIKTAEQALVIIHHGRTLGMNTFQALQTVFVVNGRPNLMAKHILGMCRAKLPGFKIRRITDQCVAKGGDDDIEVWEAKSDRDDDYHREAFSWKDMIATGSAGNANVKKFRRRHLMYKCWSLLFLVVSGDISSGFDMLEATGADESDGRILETEDYQTFHRGKPHVEQPIIEAEVTDVDPKPEANKQPAGTILDNNGKPLQKEAQPEAQPDDRDELRGLVKTAKQLIGANNAQGWDDWKKKLFKNNGVKGLNKVPLDAFKVAVKALADAPAQPTAADNNCSTPEEKLEAEVDKALDLSDEQSGSEMGPDDEEEDPFKV